METIGKGSSALLVAMGSLAPSGEPESRSNTETEKMTNTQTLNLKP